MSSPDDPTQQGAACPECGVALLPGESCPACDDATVDMAAVDPSRRGAPAGLKRLGHFEILRELGAGGMGAVYEAHDEKMNRRVALKVMSRHHAPSAKNEKRFQQEAWIAGKLDHPNLVKVYEHGEEDELHFFSMELVGGGSLYDVLRNLRQSGRDERFGLEYGTREYLVWAIERVIDAARGLDYAHGKGVVHRDIKPMNLLLRRELGTVKIADFGLALDSDVTRLTTEGKLLGTVAYMAPEQMLGQREIAGPTDVYALGVTLFELLTLKLPYRGETQQLYMNAVLTAEVRRPSKLNDKISQDLETVLRMALAKKPEERYATAGAFADDLKNVLNYRPIAARRTSLARRAIKWVQRRPVHATLLGVLIVGLPLTGLLFTRELQRRQLARLERIEDLLGQARWFEDRQRHADRLDAAVTVLELVPSDERALRHRALASARMAQDDPSRTELADAARTYAAELVERDPESFTPHATLAAVFRMLGNEEAAAAAQAHAERFRPEMPTVEVLDFDARLAMDRGDYEDAAELFGKVVELRPEDAAARGSRGSAYDFLDRNEQAMAELQIAVGINPELYTAYVDLAGLSNEAGLLEEASRWIDKAIEIKPDFDMAHTVRAQTLIERGKVAVSDGDKTEAATLFEEGERAARFALGISPDTPWALVNLGAALSERAKLQDEPQESLLLEAAAVFARALERWPEPPTDQEHNAWIAGWVGHCDTLIGLRKLDLGMSVCKRVVELLPDNPVVYYNLAGVYALKGRTDEALAALRRDVELGDDDWRYLEGDPWFAGMRDHTEFVEIIRQMREIGP